MKKSVYALALFSAILFGGSCQSMLDESLESEENFMDIENLHGIQKDIMINILSSRYGGYHKGEKKTRAVGEITMTPYVENGDTLLYVVNYSQGWEIYSAKHGANALLYSSKKGNLNLNSPDVPESLLALIQNSAKTVKEIDDTELPVNPSWGFPALTSEDMANGKITVRRKTRSREEISASDLPPGHWELIESEIIYENNICSDKLVTTRWGQDSPWNLFSKRFLNNSYHSYYFAPVGCIPVALGQYMYFTHFKDGFPVTSPSYAEEINYGDWCDYEFLGEASYLWDYMAIDKNGQTEPVALLLGYIGRMVNCLYRLDGTGSSHYYANQYLSSLYGTNFYNVEFDYETIKKYLNLGYPVISYADGTINSNKNSRASHCFLIDQYKENYTSYRYLYAWVRDPWNYPGEDDPYESDEYDEDGNLVSYAYTNEIFKDYNYFQISMNWGTEGLCDDVFYHPYGTWTLNTGEKIYHYDRDKAITIRSDKE